MSDWLPLVFTALMGIAILVYVVLDGYDLGVGMLLPAAERHPETAQMMIMNPLSGGGLRGLFSTHPSTEERVERLLAMAVQR
mgnify:CR=1 FL=1